MSTTCRLFCSILLFLTPLGSQAVVFRTCAQDFYPKFYLFNKEIRGYSIDIIKALHGVDQNIKFVGYDQFCTIPRIEKDLQAGRRDVFIASFKTPEREKKFYFVDVPLHIFRFVLVVRKDESAKIKSINDLRSNKSGDVVLTLFGTALQLFLERQPGLNLDSSGRTIEVNLRKLESGRGRYFMVTDLGIRDILSRSQWKDKFKVLPVVLASQAQYVMVSRKVPPEDVELLRHALSSLRLSGKMDDIFERYAP